eukprot:TRINITY_DN9511_c0_g1_i1.p1 TRINITY_DN9511_c0_g1~~TRINITY_DN9511_c0_g1_i1.p1  ORF type:complete len:365 (+),score=119.76 TRINITY_DN9511_c0_g1_i1:169-1263(+)
MSKLDINQSPITAEVARSRFSFYTSEDIKKMSVKRITTAEPYDKLGNPVDGGPFYPVLGPLEDYEMCLTCGLRGADCTGHFGHVELVVPVFHPISFDAAFKILQCHCFGCHKFLHGRKMTNALAKGLMLLDAGKLDEACHLMETLSVKKETTALKEFRKEIFAPDDEAEEDKDEDEDDEEEAEEDEIVDTGDYKPENGESLHVQEVRNKWVKEFLKSGSCPKKCQSCDLPARSLRRERKSGKVFLKALSKQAQKALYSKQQRYPSVIDSDVDLDAGMGDYIGDGADDDDENQENSDDDESTKRKKQAKREAKAKGKVPQQSRLMTTYECHHHMKALFQNQKTILDLIFGQFTSIDGKRRRKAII